MQLIELVFYLELIKITLSIEGMRCVKCEAHMNEAIKEAMKVKKVSSSHEKKHMNIFYIKNIYIL